MTVGGVAAVIVAMIQRWNPQEMNPGVEGSLTVGIVGSVLALVEGLPYTTVIKLMIPIWAIQYVTCQMVPGPSFAVLGIELIALGFFGFARHLLTSGSPRPRAAHV